MADLAGTVFFLLIYQTTMSPWTLVSPGNNAADELARWEALLVPSTIPCSLSPLLSHPLFSDWMRTVSSKFFDTQVPSISTKELVFPCHARCVLSHLCCNRQSLLLSSYLSKIGKIENPSLQRLWTLVLGHLFISFCTDQLQTLCAALSLATLSLYDFWTRPWRVDQLLGLHGLLPCPQPLEGVE